MAVTRTPTVWQRAQVWLGDNGEDELGALGGIDAALKKLSDARFSAIHVKLHDGQQEENAGLPKKIRDRAKALGITMLVGGWGQNRDDAHADAEKVNGLILREGADYWIAACEFEYKGDAGTTNWKRTATFLHRFRELQPTFPFGYCSMPNEVRGGSFDWQSIRAANARWIPECYRTRVPQRAGPVARGRAGGREHPVLQDVHASRNRPVRAGRRREHQGPAVHRLNAQRAGALRLLVRLLGVPHAQHGGSRLGQVRRRERQGWGRCGSGLGIDRHSSRRRSTRSITRA